MAGILGGNDTVGVLIKTTADNSGIDKTNTGLGTVGDTAKKSTNDATASFEKFNRSLGTTSDTVARLGAGMTTYISAPLAAVAISSLKMAGDYEQSLNILRSVTGATAQQMTSLSQVAKDLGNDVTLPGISAKDAALAMTELAKAGLGVNDVMSASKGVLSLAKAGQVETAFAAEVTANALNAFSLKGTEATKVADMLAGGANGSSASIQDMALGMQMASAGAAALKVPVNDLITGLGLMSNNAIKGSDAGTSLKTFMNSLTPSTDKASAAFKAMNLQMFDGQGKFVGMREAARQLQAGTANMTDQQKLFNMEAAFGSDAMRAAIVMSKEGALGFDKLSTSVNKAGAATELAAAQNAGFNGALDNLKSTAETAMIEIGSDLLPIVTAELKKATDAVSRLSDWFNELSPSQKEFLIDAAKIAIVLGPATLAVGKLGRTVSDVGSLFAMASKGMLLMRGASLATAGAGGLGALTAGAGGTTAALAGGGGLLAALGPVALGLGAIAVVAGGTYLAVKHFDDLAKEDARNLRDQVSPATREYRQLAEDLGVTLTGTSNGSTLLAIAQNGVKNAQDMSKAATEQHDQAIKNFNNTQQIAKQKGDDLKVAQDAVRDAHDKFGANSPQYQAAVDNLKQKQNDYNWALADTVTKNLDLTVKTGNYKDALGILNTAVHDATGLQKFFNDQLNGGVGVVAQFGPTALAQIGGIAQLQQSIGGVISSWNQAVINIQGQSPAINNILFGTSSTIQRIQGQSDAINNTLKAANGSAKTLQGASTGLQGSGGKLQGNATGTNYFRGGATMVGEDGPEVAILPAGTQIKSAPQTRSMMQGGAGGGSTTNQTVNNYQNVSVNKMVLPTGEAATSWWADLNQDNLLVSRGFTANKGAGA